MGLHLSQKLADILFLLALDIGTKADGLLVQPLFDDLFQTVKGAAADEQNVLGVHLDELLMGVLPAALGRHVGHGALHDFQQRLLHAFAGNVPGDGGVFALAGNFVDLIHIDDAPLGPLHVEIRRLQKPQQDVLHIVAHVAGLGQGRGVGNGEGHLQNTGQSLSEQRFAGAGGAQHQNVALLKLHIVAAAEIDPLIVIVDRHGQRYLGGFLSDDIFIQHRPDLLGGGQLIGDVLQGSGLRAVEPLVQNAHTKLHALVADADAGALDHTMDLLFPLSAEGTAQGLFAFVTHGITSFTS